MTARITRQHLRHLTVEQFEAAMEAKMEASAKSQGLTMEEFKLMQARQMQARMQQQQQMFAMQQQQRLFQQQQQHHQHHDHSHGGVPCDHDHG